MIKCNVTIRGKVSRAASVRTDKNGKQTATFAIRVMLQGKPEGTEAEIFVNSSDLNLANGVIAVGKVVEMQGELTFKKQGDNIWLNFAAASVNPAPVETADLIEGTMEAKCTVGKTIEEKVSKNGNKYLTFSAFSAEKVGDGFEYIWIRFVRFAAGREAFLQPKAKVLANGKLDISVYQGRINLSCRLDELTERQGMPFYQDQDGSSKLPF
jgi:hypothetical protein